jgi:hypothetical protein
MHTFPKYHPATSKFIKMVSEQDMENAINALDAQLIPNYRQTGLKFGIDRTTLMRRHKGITTSRAEATSIHHKCLTDT